MEIKYYDRQYRQYEPRKYGTYHHGEGCGWRAGSASAAADHIKWVEENAPSMSEKLWKIREQLTIAEKEVFDSIIELPPMKKREVVSKVAIYLGRSNGQVRLQYNSVVAALKEIY